MISRIKSNILIKNIATLVSGVAIAQIIVFASQMIIRRYYSVSDFGAFDVYMSIVGVATAFVSLRYEFAVVLPKEDKVAINLTFAGLLFTFLFTILFYIILFTSKVWIIKILDFPKQYSYWLYILPLSVLFFSSFNILNYWLIRKQKFKILSYNKVLRRSSESATQISLGYVNNNWGLVLGDLTGNVLNFFYALIVSLRSGLHFSYISIRKMIYAIKKYKEFPLYNLAPNFFNILSYTIPIFVLNSYFGKSEVAYLNLTRQVLVIPLALLSASISQVLLQRISTSYNEKKSVKKDLRNILIPLIGLALLEITVLLIFGEFLFSLLFGDEWIMSGKIAKILVFSFALQTIVTPFTILFISFKKIKLQATWQIGYFLLMLSLYLFKNINFDSFLNLYLFIDILAYSTYMIMIIIMIWKYERSIKSE